MTITVQNTGDAAVFFDQAVGSTAADNLISAQVDPSQPQVRGLTTVTNPVVTDQHLSVRLSNFDPAQFDLSSTAHLVKLLTALLAGAGVGGLRRQQIIARLSSTLAGTSFIELDGFWGALFGLTRAPEEALPTNAVGAALNPASDVADSATWDVAAARDARYRARIEQLARGFAHGATYHGLRKAAQAVLNCEVEVVESWTLADFAVPGGVSYTGNTWQAVASQYSTWDSIDGVSWGSLEAGAVLPVGVPVGNRGEIVVIPGREITDAERMQLHRVSEDLLPANTMLTISTTPFTSEAAVPVRSVYADSVHWAVTSAVTGQTSVETNGVDLYPGGTAVESARPALSQYSGEKWSYNSRVARVASYALDATGRKLPQVDYQTVTFADGNRHAYVPAEALLDSQQLALSRAAAEGVLTTFPYAEGRM